MKKILIVCAGLIIFLLQSCYEDYKNDFDSTSTYFSLQSPLRTLVVEDGKDLSLEVGVVLSGKYSNDVQETVNFEIMPSMLDGVNLEMLPETHYQISNKEQFVIKKGEILGTVGITLTDAFVNDTLAHTVHYALPFKITGSTTDLVLSEKDSTIVAVRYQNKYYGAYWIKGVDYTVDANGIPTDTATYSNADLVDNVNKIFGTLAKDTSLVPYVGVDVSGDNTMKFAIKDDGSLTIYSGNTKSFTNVTGSGMYHKEEEIFILDYTYEDGVASKHHVLDTLYKFDTPMSLELWTDAEFGIVAGL